MPKIEFKSAARPSLYAYPPPLEEKKREEREKVSTAILSIAARQKRREDKKKDDSKMDVDEEVKEDEPKKEEAKKEDPKKATDKKDKKQKTDEKEKEKSDDATTAAAAPKERKEPEPTFEILQNPPRVLRQQLKVVSIADGFNYQPVKDVTIGGIIMMKYTAQNEQVLVEPVAAYGPKSNDDVKEPEAPEPFEYVED